VVNAVELALAVRAGCPAERLVMNGVGKTTADQAAAIAADALINAESLSELEELVAAGAPRIGLRLNPGLDADTHPHLATGAAGSKFGIAWFDLDRVLAIFPAPEAIGAHIGSAISDPAVYAELARRLAGIAGTGRINLGGGPAIGMSPAELADAIRPFLPDASRLILEPGRSLVAEAGWLLTSVVRVQPRADATYLVVDAGMTELIRPVLYGADHPVSAASAGAPFDPVGPVHLAGPICEAGDVLARDIGRWLSAAEMAVCGPGAVLAIGEAGAYGAVMASGYNGRLRPAEAVIDGGERILSRRRETFDDLLARDLI
jgi:diaminopimelate decarboxylase